MAIVGVGRHQAGRVGEGQQIGGVVVGRIAELVVDAVLRARVERGCVGQELKTPRLVDELVLGVPTEVLPMAQGGR